MEKQVTETQYICDVCGRKADGDFFMDMHVNDDYNESYYCPLDLCKDCMQNFEMFLGEHEVNMMKFLYSRRSDLRCNKTNKKVLLRELKRMRNDSLEPKVADIKRMYEEDE